VVELNEFHLSSVRATYPVHLTVLVLVVVVMIMPVIKVLLTQRKTKYKISFHMQVPNPDTKILHYVTMLCIVF
jgi:hypothetical protein